jgi:uncharacterized protein with ParB-like and HNH nuclease domain
MTVPPNQRSYAWRVSNVRDLLLDLNAAIQEGDQEEYFLGTVVLVASGGGIPQIADGQQRIATTSIILARIRDLLMELDDKDRAVEADKQYIQGVDMESGEKVPHLQMNHADNEFYRNIISRSLANKQEVTAAKASAKCASNVRLLQASETILSFLRDTLLPLRGDSHARHLVRWITFIQKRASVVAVTVPDEVGAYRIFETLNDRGLKASQVDILKNYLFSKTPVLRIDETHALWNEMTGTISSLPEDEDANLVNYIRAFWITKNGLTRHKDLAKNIKEKINNEPKSMQFISDLRSAAVDYTALWLPTHSKWQPYSTTTRQNLYTLFFHLKAEQIIPLLFSVALHFDREEADKAFKLFVSWSVRFLIAGGTRGGRLEKPYGDLAQSIGNGEIKKAREIRDGMKTVVPNDKEFEEAFAIARVSKTHLARYYLRAIDQTMKNDPTPEYIPNDDEKEINLEHVMPLSVENNWDVDEEEADTAQKLIGNMVLLSAKKNVQLGNLSFEKKRLEFAQSSYSVTNQVAQYETWGLEQIRSRQAELAKIAVRTWTLDFKKD